MVKVGTWLQGRIGPLLVIKLCTSMNCRLKRGWGQKLNKTCSTFICWRKHLHSTSTKSALMSMLRELVSNGLTSNSVCWTGLGFRSMLTFWPLKWTLTSLNTDFPFSILLLSLSGCCFLVSMVSQAGSVTKIWSKWCSTRISLSPFIQPERKYG